MRFFGGYDLNAVRYAAILLLVFAAIGSAETRIPLSLSKLEYASRAGETVKLELSDASAAMLKRGKALTSHATPEVEHAPFATTDTKGNLVIAVPLLSPPGAFSVSITAQDEDGNAHAAVVSLSVRPVTPVPVGVVPVILLNGYQTFFSNPLQFSSCPVGTAQGTFGTLPAALNLSYFFDNCADCPNCPIESLGADLGAFLNLLRYTDGTPVPQADVVAHSMGGLIVRAYLSGKQTVPGYFAPPSSTNVRKAVFIGTPHFGSFLAGDFGTQATEMYIGSQFLWDLNRWNQGVDSLREVDAIAIVGNGSTTGQSDGVVDLTSASLSFEAADVRTRIIDGCHVPPFLLIPLCSTTQSIAQSPDSITIVTSFLAGNSTWSTIGHPPSQDAYLSQYGGRFIAFFSASDVPQSDVTNMVFGNHTLDKNPDTGATFYSDFLPGTSGMLTFTAQGQGLQSSITIRAGGYGTTLIKYPPVMMYARPAAAQINTLNIAPGSLISIFGSGLASSTVTSSFPWPTHLADVTLTANGQPLQLLYVGSAQINAYFPTNLSGLVTLQLTNSLGEHTLNVMTTNASPAIFSADSSGTGLAAAIHATTGQPVTTSSPATAGEYVEIYGTGFGSTYQSGGLSVTSLTPTLTIGDESATVSFCGMPQGGVGLYQINFIVPSGLPSGTNPLAIAMGNYVSNSVTLPVRWF